MSARHLRLSTLLACCLLATGCAGIAGSSLNPLNWFGAARPVEARAATGPVAPLVPATGSIVGDRRVALSQVTRLVVDRTPDGAIVRATGLAPGPGHFNAQLVRIGVVDSVLTYDFRAEAPPGARAGGSAAQRRITAADPLSQAESGAIRAVRVRSAGNSLQASR